MTLTLVRAPLKVGDQVRVPSWYASLERTGHVTLIDGKYARVKRFGRFARAQIWFRVADLERERDTWADHQRQRRQRNRRKTA